MEASLLVLLAAGGAALAMTAAGLTFLVAWLRRRAVLDIPNHRSSHSVPTPRGGGLAVTAVILLGWTMVLAWSGALDAALLALLAGGLVLAAVSWLDDLSGLSHRLRLAVQVVAIGATVALLPDGFSVTQGLVPPLVERLGMAVAWIWFTNLFNFMDGIDGLSGAEAAHLGAGVTVVAAVGGLAAWPLGPLGMVVAGAALAFLVWNWHPAKVFLGDVGSVPLGFLLGGLLMALAASGAWAAALILPAYYLADATLTLVSRLLRGKSPVEAHRDHVYQRACGRLAHDAVVRRIAATNGVLLAAAVVAEAVMPLPGLAIAVIAVAVALWRLGREAGPGEPCDAPAAKEVQPR